MTATMPLQLLHYLTVLPFAAADLPLSKCSRVPQQQHAQSIAENRGAKTVFNTPVKTTTMTLGLPLPVYWLRWLN